jgi:hypothetical protein
MHFRSGLTIYESMGSAQQTKFRVAWLSYIMLSVLAGTVRLTIYKDNGMDETACIQVVTSNECAGRSKRAASGKGIYLYSGEHLRGYCCAPEKKADRIGLCIYRRVLIDRMRSGACFQHAYHQKHPCNWHYGCRSSQKIGMHPLSVKLRSQCGNITSVWPTRFLPAAHNHDTAHVGSKEHIKTF